MNIKLRYLDSLPMEKMTGLVFFFFVCVSLHAQNSNTSEKAFINVVKEGPSTGPDFIVVKINNLNTGTSKEVCTDVTSLFFALQVETKEDDNNKITQYLLSKSATRTFDLRNPEALDRLDFNLYTLHDEKKIESLITNQNLRDSLRKLTKFGEVLSSKMDDHYDKRQDILKEISDSIKKVRPLTDEEAKMIGDLRDRYYDDYYTKPIYDRYRTVSANGEFLMKIWSEKIKRYKDEISKYEAESKRMYDKFFQQYYKMFGISFCHVAFKYGIITYFGDENPKVGFSRVL